MTKIVLALIVVGVFVMFCAGCYRAPDAYPLRKVTCFDGEKQVFSLIADGVDHVGESVMSLHTVGGRTILVRPGSSVCAVEQLTVEEAQKTLTPPPAATPAPKPAEVSPVPSG